MDISTSTAKVVPGFVTIGGRKLTSSQPLIQSNLFSSIAFA